jgi:hypothetical protein
VAAAQAAEDAAARREEREAERAREARREQLADGALSLYRSQAESRGEAVSAMAIARGEVGGRDVLAILADATAAADREDARQRARDRREDVVFLDSEPVIHGASRSAWPESEWELDRQLRRAADLHTDLVQTRTRLASRQGRAAEHIEAHRAAAERAHERDLRRDQPTAVLTAHSEASRDSLNCYDAGFGLAVRGVEGAIVSVR